MLFSILWISFILRMNFHISIYLSVLNHLKLAAIAKRVLLTVQLLPTVLAWLLSKKILLCEIHKSISFEEKKVSWKTIALFSLIAFLKMDMKMRNTKKCQKYEEKRKSRRAKMRNKELAMAELTARSTVAKLLFSLFLHFSFFNVVWFWSV